MSSLSKYEMAETGVLHLRDASDALMYADNDKGQPDPSKPMRVHLYGPGSKQYARAMNDKQNHNVDLLKRKGKTKESPEEATQSNAEFLAACTHSFENIDDAPLDVYLNQKLSFIRDQISVFLNETANFTKGSSKP
jgi:hypothetical protein